MVECDCVLHAVILISLALRVKLCVLCAVCCVLCAVYCVLAARERWALYPIGLYIENHPHHTIIHNSQPPSTT